MPDSAVEVVKPAFKKLVAENAELTLIADGMGFTEGCCYVPNGDYLIWSDIPNNRIHRWSETNGVSVFREPSGNTNGNTVDREGRILHCETGGRQVSISELDGSVHPYIHQYGGRKLNSPNDIIVKSDGSVWFSDPDYGVLHPELGHGEQPEQETNRLYRFDPETRRVRSVVDDMDKPNGLAFSPDESVLYVAISRTGEQCLQEEERGEFCAHRKIRAFDVAPDGTLRNNRVFADMASAEPGVPDGLKVDTEGRIFCTGSGGIWVLDPAGNKLGVIRGPEVPRNMAFGGPDFRTVYTTPGESLYSFRVKTPGIGAY